jgi:hypothetical protein
MSIEETFVDCCFLSENKYSNNDFDKRVVKLVREIDILSEPEAELDYFNNSWNKIQRAEQEEIALITPPWVVEHSDLDDIKQKINTEKWNYAVQSAKEIEASKINEKYCESKIRLDTKSIKIKQFADLKIFDNDNVKPKSYFNIIDITICLIFAFAVFYSAVIVYSLIK